MVSISGSYTVRFCWTNQISINSSEDYALHSLFLLRVVRDVDKAEIGLAVTFIIVQSYTEELETDILEQG